MPSLRMILLRCLGIVGSSGTIVASAETVAIVANAAVATAMAADVAVSRAWQVEAKMIIKNPQNLENEHLGAIMTTMITSHKCLSTGTKFN